MFPIYTMFRQQVVFFLSLKWIHGSDRFDWIVFFNDLKLESDFNTEDSYQPELWSLSHSQKGITGTSDGKRVTVHPGKALQALEMTFLSLISDFLLATLLIN